MAKTKKMNYLPFVLAAAGAGAIWYFRKDIGSFLGLTKKADEVIDEVKDTMPEITTTVVDTLPGSTATVKTLSPLGTPKDKLQFDTELSLGDKGQEVAKLQQILNRIAGIYGTQKIAEDGVMGVGTQSKLNKIFGKSTISVRKAYYLLFAIWNATQNKEQKKWFDKYYKFYLTQPDRVTVARNNYFKKNPVI
jgi:hypothetical protein